MRSEKSVTSAVLNPRLHLRKRFRTCHLYLEFLNLRSYIFRSLSFFIFLFSLPQTVDVDLVSIDEFKNRESVTVGL